MIEDSFAPRQPIEMISRSWETLEVESEAIYEMIILNIDWDRILIAACATHMRHLNDEQYVEEHPNHILVEDLCGPCVLEALLSKER